MSCTETCRYLFKFVVTLPLAVSAHGPGIYGTAKPMLWRRCQFWILVPSLYLLASAAALEPCLLPSSLWKVSLVGSNSINCMSLIPLPAAFLPASLLVQFRHGPA